MAAIEYVAAIEYEIFNDLLDVILNFIAIAVAAVAIVVAGLSYVIYKGYNNLNDKIKKDAASAAKTEMYKALVLYHLSCGLDYWNGYKNGDYLFSMDSVSEKDLNNEKLPIELMKAFNDKKIPRPADHTIMTEKKDEEWVITDKNMENILVVKKEERKPQIYNIYKRDIRTVNQAIETTELGYERYVKKSEKQEQEWLEQIQVGEFLICKIKNNLAYYYAERKKFGKDKKDDADRALEFADYVNTSRHNYPGYYSSYGRTHKFVYEQFSPTIDK